MWLLERHIENINITASKVRYKVKTTFPLPEWNFKMSFAYMEVAGAQLFSKFKSF